MLGEEAHRVRDRVGSQKERGKEEKKKKEKTQNRMCKPLAVPLPPPQNPRPLPSPPLLSPLPPYILHPLLSCASTPSPLFLNIASLSLLARHADELQRLPGAPQGLHRQLQHPPLPPMDPQPRVAGQRHRLPRQVLRPRRPPQPHQCRPRPPPTRYLPCCSFFFSFHWQIKSIAD